MDPKIQVIPAACIIQTSGRIQLSIIVRSMFKKVIIYPFLFVLDLILIPLSVNLGQIDPTQAIRPLFILLVFCVLAFVVLALFLRSWHYAGYLTFLVLVFQFLYGHLWHWMQDQVHI